MEIEELKKRFILSEDLERLNIEGIIEKLLKLCTVDKSGFVVISESIRKKLTIREKMLLVATARFLARKLQEKSGDEVTISDIVTGDEFARMTGDQKNVILARAKDLKDERKFISENPGKFKIAPYFVENFVDEITSKGE